MLRSHLNINGEKALQKETCIRKERWFLFLFNKPQESKRDKVNFQITALSNVLVFFKKKLFFQTPFFQKRSKALMYISGITTVFKLKFKVEVYGGKQLF
jgi:hypothetical protein